MIEMIDLIIIKDSWDEYEIPIMILSLNSPRHSAINIVRQFLAMINFGTNLE